MNWSLAIPWAPPLAPEERAEARWNAGAQDALRLLTEATRIHPEITSFWGGPGSAPERLLDLPEPLLLERLHTVLRRFNGKCDCYVGSTSSARWRWEGGWYWPSEAATGIQSTHQEYMPGHRLSWRNMVVLGAWPDAETARLEPICISVARSIASDRLKNKATDARGLEIRRWCYSFVYVVSTCT